MYHHKDLDEYYKKLEAFYKKYPDLFPGGRPHCGFSCGEGWFNILKELFEKMIKREIVKNTDFCIDQIKEKFGGLRVYTSLHDDEIESFIKEAERRSFKTCESCGKPGKPRGEGWVKTRCDDCQEEFEKRMI